MSIVKLLVLLAVIAAPFIALFIIPLIDYSWGKNGKDNHTFPSSQ